MTLISGAISIPIFYIEAYIFPSTVPRDESLLMLQSLIQLNGILIGFTGLIGTILAVRQPSNQTSLTLLTGVSISVLMVSFWFLFSIVDCIYYIALLGNNSLMSIYGVLFPLYFVTVGIIRLAAFALGQYPIVLEKMT